MNVPLVTHLFVFLYYYDCGHLQYLLLDWQDVWRGFFFSGEGWWGGGQEAGEVGMSGGQVRKGGDTQSCMTTVKPSDQSRL